MLIWSVIATLAAFIWCENLSDQERKQEIAASQNRSRYIKVHNDLTKFKTLFEHHKKKSIALRQEIFDLKNNGN